MDKIKEYLERTSKIVTEIIEDSETYKLEDISELTKLNCLVAETLLKIEGERNGAVRTSKKSFGNAKKQK